MPVGDIVDPCVCMGWEIWRSQDPLERQKIPTASEGREDEDGYLVCPFCHKVEQTYLKQLAECDECDNLFKGYKKYPKFAYTCPECEAKYG